MITLINNLVYHYVGISTAVFFLALAGLVNPVMLIIILALATLTFFACTKYSETLLAQRTPLLHTSIILGLVIAMSHVLLIPSYLRDDMIYHLLVPKIISQGSFPIDPLNINANFPMLFEMPLTYFESFKMIQIPPQSINLIFLALLCLSYYQFAVHTFKINPSAIILSIACIITTPAVYELTQSCYVEIFFSLALLLATYQYLQFTKQPENITCWYRCMFFLGVMCATKYFGLFVAAFFITKEFFSSTQRRYYYNGFALFLLPCFGWYIKNWLYLDNPVFPLLPFIFETPDVSVGRIFRFFALPAHYNLTETFLDYLLLPFRMVSGFEVQPGSENFGMGGKLSYFYALSFLGLGASNRKSRLISALFVIYFLLWLTTSQLIRYILPFMILSSLSGLFLLDRFQRKSRLIIYIFFIAALVQNVNNISSDMKQNQFFALVTGAIGKKAFLEKQMPISYKFAQQVNRQTSQESDIVYTIGTFGRNYYFDVRTLTNTYWDTEYIDKAFMKEELNSSLFDEFLAKNNITHLLFNDGYFLELHKDNPNFDLVNFKQYIQQNFTVLAQQNAVYLFGYQKN